MAENYPEIVKSWTTLIDDLSAETIEDASMFGLFKKKPPTTMDALIRTIYGPIPPSKFETAHSLPLFDETCVR
jgi:hypothetical protein